MNTSDLFKLNGSDFAKGLVVAVLAAVLGSIQAGLSGHGLDFASYNWGSILDIAVTAGIGYLAKNFISDSSGRVLGAIG